jgi:membrane-bound ClpP family serine protease
LGLPQIVPDKGDAIKQAANQLASAADADVYLYNGETRRPSDEEVLCCCMDRKRRKNAILILVTEGGDPDAAYRIARCFQEHYELFTCIVPGYCKSAGTLITIGAHELVMTDGGELGPLDIQDVKERRIVGESIGPDRCGGVECSS